MPNLISSIYNSTSFKKSYESYWQNTDINYNINRIENTILDIIHTPNEENDNEEKEEYNKFYLGRLQTWYIGKELNSMGNLTSYNLSQDTLQQTKPPTVKQSVFDNDTGKYTQSDPFDIYKTNN